ncbi:MAG: zinc ribbon domain-containing protein [Gemmatimonadales bacterium]
MHADLVKLLDLQNRDSVVDEIHQRMEALTGEFAGLDKILQGARDLLEGARRAAADGIRRRNELEARVDSYRLLQERRTLRLEHVRNPKEAATLMAELDLARSVIAKEETEWVRSAEAVGSLELKVAEEEKKLEALAETQQPERSKLEARRAELQEELHGAKREREESASRIERQLRTRYDRLRRSRAADVVVPLLGGTCGACHTSIPLNRRSQIRSGAVLDTCEGCGAILYPQEVAGSA